MLATLATKPFDDPDWLFEIKWDGFRVQAVVDHGKVRILTRNLHDADDLLPAAARPAGAGSRPTRPSSTARSWRSTRTAGPTSACSRPSSATRRRTGSCTRRSTCSTSTVDRCSTCPLEDRKRLLRSVLKEHPRVRFASHVVGRGEGVLRGGRARSASRAWWPSSVARGTSRAGASTPGSRSRSGRSRSWWSVAGPRGVATPATSVRWPSGSTRTASCGSPARSAAASPGRSGPTCSSASSRSVQDDPPFDPAPPKDYRGRWGGDLKDITWVRPELVIRAEIGGWTRDGQVRQTAYKGIEPAATRRP